MNKKVGIIIAVVVILALVGFFVLKMGKSTTQVSTNKTPVTQTTVAVANKAETVQGTIKSLITAGKSEVCTYTNQVSSATINGKIYVADGKMRGDFTSVSSAKGESVNSHIIINDAQSVYAWTDLSSRGMKISITAGEKVASTSGNPDINQQVQLSCQGWTPDASLFTVPSTVTFYSLDTLTKPAAGANAACSACANLPAQAQAACKTQLNCQ